MIGETIGTYRIESKRGEGGMGVFYRATDINLDRVVGLKTLRPEYEEDTTFRARLLREAKVLARLNHPNIASLWHYLEDGSQVCLVVEFVEGLDLGEILKSDGPLPPARAIRYVQDILDALSYAHQQGVVHRDIKPSNVLIDTADQVKVTDFGIAKLRDAKKLTQTGSGIGSYLYMAPEQVEGGEIDGRTDLYSAAITLFEITTGRVPFDSESEYKLMTMIMSEPPPALSQVNPAVPPEIDAIVAKALAKRPDDRFADAAEFKDALRRIGILSAASAPAPARDTAAPTAARPAARVAAAPSAGEQRTRVGGLRKKPKKAAVLAGIAGLVVIAAGVTWFVTREPEQGQQEPPSTATTPTDTIPGDQPSPGFAQLASERYAAGREAEDAGELQRAVDIYQEVLSLDPNFPELANGARIAELESRLAGLATLTFTIQPFNRRGDLNSLVIDGRPVNGPPWKADLAGGRHTIRYATAEGTFTDTVTTGGADGERALTLWEGVGRLNIAADNLPPGIGWAEIYVDGVKSETTAPGRLNGVPAGPHEIELRHAGGGRTRSIIHVESPGPTRATLRFGG